jgi:hypothetical protein
VFDDGPVIPVGQPGPPGTANASTVFDDVADSPYQPEIRELAAQGLLAGIAEKRFGPTECVKRGDWAVMVALAARLQGDPRCAERPFSDVDPADPRCAAIAAAAGAGFIAGLPGGTFRPDDALPRYQAVVSLAAGAGLPAGKSDDPLVQQHLPAAWSRIPAWAQYAVAVATRDRLNILAEKSPDAGAFECTQRQEAAGLLFRYVQARPGTS